MNGYELVRSQPSHDETTNKVKDFFDNGGKVGGAIKGVEGTNGHRFLEHTGVFNGRNSLMRISTANVNGYPAIINMIEDKDTPSNGNGFVFTLGNGKGGDQYRNSFFRPISKAYGSGSMNLGSPSFPWDDLWLGQHSKASNGHTKLPNGFILQWGTVAAWAGTGGSVYKRITLPISFSNTNYFIVANVVPQLSWDNGAMQGVSIKSNSSAEVVFRVDREQNVEVTFFALGY